MYTIRIGNDINVTWKLFARTGSRYAMDNKDISLWLISGPYKSELASFQVQSHNEIVFSIDAEDLKRYGIYKLLLRFKEANAPLDDSAYDLTEMFQIVSKTYTDGRTEVLDGAVDIEFTSILNDGVVIEGKSAYEIAVQDGYTGTEEEWLESLHAHITSGEIKNALGFAPVSPTQLAEKVDKDGDKVLSDNNFSNAYKTKLDNVDASVTSAQQSAAAAQQAVSGLASILADATVDESVIDVAEVSELLSETDIKAENNKQYVFGTTVNYIDGKYVYSNGTINNKSGWIVTDFIDVSGFLLVGSASSIEWVYGANQSGCCIWFCKADKETTTAYWEANDSSGSRTLSLSSSDAANTKYVRASFKKSFYDELVLKINNRVVWRPQETVAGLVPSMETAQGNISDLINDTTRVPFTTKYSTTNTASTPSSKIVGIWNESSAIVGTAVTSTLGYKCRFVADGYSYTSWRFIVVPCNPGDQFIVSGKTSNDFRLWYFFDNAFSVVGTKYSYNREYPTTKITAPEGASYIAINWKHEGVEPVTTPKFFKIVNGSLRQMVENLQATVGNYGPTDIVSLNPDREYKPKFIAAKRMSKVNTTPLVIAHFSDIHASSATNLKRFIEYCDKYDSYIDVRLNTGDTVPSTYEDLPATQSDWWYRKTSGAEKILYAIGNHDVASYSNGAWNWTAHIGEDAYNAYIAPFLSTWDVDDHPTGEGVYACYYYKDFSTNNVRLIVLDAMNYTDDQDTWLDGVLASALSAGRHVVVAAHFPGVSHTGIACAFTTRKYSSISGGSSYGTGISGAIGTIDNFINDGGNFVCWLCGHTHYDYISKITGHDQLVITIDTASYDTGQTNAAGSDDIPYSDIAHTSGTKLQDCFNIVSIDTATKLIKIFRVGCDVDVWMRKKDMICLSYDTLSIVG